MILSGRALLGAFLILGFSFFAQKKNIVLELSYYEPYCGGARPTEEILAEAQKPKPYAGRKVILVAKSGKVDTLTTDARGKVKLKLKRGEYSLMETWRYYKKSFNGTPLEQYDMACLKTEWTKTIALLSVGRKETKINFTNELHNYCEWSSPCLLEAHTPPARE